MSESLIKDRSGHDPQRSKRSIFDVMRMDGRVALVTGGSRGIGASVSEALAELGAKVVISSRDQEACELQAAKINRIHPEGATAVAAHAGRDEDLFGLVDRVMDSHGRIDILVNNAATNAHFGPVLEVDRAAWEKTFEVNLRGPLVLIQSVFERSMREHGGAIVNIASIGGISPVAGIGVYNVSKAALIHLTRQLCRELGPSVRINVVAPGLIRTRMAEALWSDAELMQDVAANHPLGRIGESSEVAASIAFLCSDAASYVNGQVLTVDGGGGPLGQ